MRRTLLPMLLALCAAAQGEVRITGAYPTDRSGARIAPVVGEPYYLTVNLSVKNQAAPYRVAVDSPDRSITDTVGFGVGAPGDYWLRRGPMVALFDGPQEVVVTCSAAKEAYRLKVVPAAPAVAIEAYAPRRLEGSYGVSVRFDRPSERLLAWLPIPQNDRFQSVDAVFSASSQAQTRETAQPLALVESWNSPAIEAEATCATTAASARVNLALLRSVKMSAVSKGTVWLKEEARIQSGHSEIKAFVKSAIKGFGAKTPVVDVAQAVYSAVLRRSVYASVDRLPDALTTLRTGNGECGDLSALFVAACRAAGVPARTVSGFTLGENAWHVWAEFMVPNHGWVPVDPAYALGLRANAKMPLYFGVVPELRDRVSVAYGFDATFGNHKTTFLQTPQVFASDSRAKPLAADFWCALRATDGRP